MAANEYRSYLRNHLEMETGQPRFHAAQSTAPTYRSLIFGTLAVIGLLQVASSVAILLHLTGYLREVDLSSTQPLEEMRTEPYLADALKDPRKRTKCPKKREVIPEAHLPIRGPIDFSNTEDEKTVMIHWNDQYGRLKKIRYSDGRILVEKGGLYYVYAKTCFRHYVQGAGSSSDQPDVSNAQLIQYVYHEKHTQSTIKPILLMKSGSTMRWDDKHYNMYCVQQGRGIHLNQGDGIFVNVSNSWLLDPEPEGSYFGALKLGTINELC